jgi:acyl-CoA thioesterase FadM
MHDLHGKKKFTSSFFPRFSDFDLQGILNSRQYIDLLAEARFDQMLRCYKYPIDSYVKRNQHWVVSNLCLDFVSPIYPGKAVNVSTSVYQIEGPKAYVAFTFETLSSTNALKTHAFGKAEYVLIDLNTKQPVEISKEEKDIYL